MFDNRQQLLTGTEISKALDIYGLYYLKHRNLILCGTRDIVYFLLLWIYQKATLFGKAML